MEAEKPRLSAFMAQLYFVSIPNIRFRNDRLSILIRRNVFTTHVSTPKTAQVDIRYNLFCTIFSGGTMAMLRYVSHMTQQYDVEHGTGLTGAESRES